VKYAYIEHLKDKYPVKVICRVIRASRSAYYEWCKDRVCPRQEEREKLTEEIKVIHAESRGTYGSPRILRELRSDGRKINHKRVESIMTEQGIKARRHKKFKQTTDSSHKMPIAPNLLNREFSVRKPNLVWVTDITYCATEEGWMYLATFVDLFSRKVVGWSMSARMTADLVVDAFKMAVLRQGKAPLMVHSDRGSQYASDKFQNEMREHRCMRSMSKKGDCWDNSVAESFFATLKTELIHHEKFRTREQARVAVFDYIEVFYNRRRRHSHLGYQSPEEFESNYFQFQRLDEIDKSISLAPPPAAAASHP
jgi:transposase InsO family protein